MEVDRPDHSHSGPRLRINVAKYSWKADGHDARTAKLAETGSTVKATNGWNATTHKEKNIWLEYDDESRALRVCVSGVVMEQVILSDFHKGTSSKIKLFTHSIAIGFRMDRTPSSSTTTPGHSTATLGHSRRFQIKFRTAADTLHVLTIIRRLATSFPGISIHETEAAAKAVASGSNVRAPGVTPPGYDIFKGGQVPSESQYLSLQMSQPQPNPSSMRADAFGTRPAHRPAVGSDSMQDDGALALQQTPFARYHSVNQSATEQTEGQPPFTQESQPMPFFREPGVFRASQDPHNYILDTQVPLGAPEYAPTSGTGAPSGASDALEAQTELNVPRSYLDVEKQLSIIRDRAKYGLPTTLPYSQASNASQIRGGLTEHAMLSPRKNLVNLPASQTGIAASQDTQAPVPFAGVAGCAASEIPGIQSRVASEGSSVTAEKLAVGAPYGVETGRNLRGVVDLPLPQLRQTIGDILKDPDFGRLVELMGSLPEFRVLA